MDVSASIEMAVSHAETDYGSFLTDVANFGSIKLGGSFTVPGTLDLPDVPADTVVTYQTDKMFDPDAVLAGGWPVYVAPISPDWAALWATVSTHDDRVWQSTDLDALALKLAEIVQGGNAVWLTAEYQSRIYDRDSDRRLQTLNDMMDIAAARHAARGNRMPNSSLSVQESELLQKYQFDNTEQSREIAKVVEEAAMKYMQFGIEKGLTLEEINMKFTSSFDQMILETVKSRYETFIRQIEAESGVFKSQVMAIVSKLEAEKTAWDLTNSYNNMLLDADMAPWKKYKLQVETLVLEYQEKVRLYGTRVDAEVKAMQERGRAIGQIMTIGSQSEITLLTGKVA